MQQIKIRKLEKEELLQAGDFAPKEWNIDLVSIMKMHWDEDYFYPFGCFISDVLAGVGHAFIGYDIGWLGNIIVLPGYRHRGLGTELAATISLFLTKKGCKTQLLFATEMGERVYKKLGFKPFEEYSFFRGEKMGDGPNDSNIRKLEEKDFLQVLKLDRKSTGEIRQRFLLKYAGSGWVHLSDDSQEVDGFFLPTLGNGLIIASNATAGIELLHLKQHDSSKIVVIPSKNIAGIDFLVLKGYTRYLKTHRMILGPEPDWKPENIFCRGAGYCG